LPGLAVMMAITWIMSSYSSGRSGSDPDSIF
jgi:hypothetical protein